jgi:hypothetical protein
MDFTVNLRANFGQSITTECSESTVFKLSDAKSLNFD